MRLACSWMSQILHIFVNLGNICFFPNVWYFFPVSIDLWKISCRMGANFLCNVCRTMGLNLSGPATLCGFKHTSSLSMPPADMLISGIFGWRLGCNGTSGGLT